eukprot:5058969-Pyramimonas_sp.AAC.1
MEFLHLWYDSAIDGFSAKYDFNDSFAVTPKVVYQDGRSLFNQTATYADLKHDIYSLGVWKEELGVN